MPSRPRREIFDPFTVGIYHVYNKIVLGQFLLGSDRRWGWDFSHRKEWFRRELRVIALTMAFDILDYALMGNHFHLLLRNRPDLLASWSDEEVVRRWYRLFPQSFDEHGNPVVPTPWQLRLWAQDQERVAELRRRLGDLSWLMAIVQQRVARQANWEQETTGSHFWSGRFKARRIENDGELLTCSLYINLNPLQAGITGDWNDPSYTSLFERIRESWHATRDELYESPTTSKTGQSAESPRLVSYQRSHAAPPPSSAGWLAELFIDERAVAYVSPTAGSAAVSQVSTTTAVAAMETVSEDPSQGPIPQKATPEWLPAARASNKGYLPLRLPDYIALMKWTIARLRGDSKRPCVTSGRILERVGWDPDYWISAIRQAINTMARRLGTSQCAIPPAPS